MSVSFFDDFPNKHDKGAPGSPSQAHTSPSGANRASDGAAYASTSTPYGQQALESELAALASAGEGYRNATLNDVAFRVFQLVDAGHLVEHEAWSRLGDTARMVGLTASEITKTVRSARTGARTKPRRDVPDPNQPPPVNHDAFRLYVPPPPPGHSGGSDAQPDGATPATEAPANPYDAAYLYRPQLGDLPRGEPLIEDAIDQRALVMLVGRDQSYKSFVALDWLLCVACGRPWQGKPVQQGRVLYVVGEGAYGLHSRISAWEQANHETVPEGALTVRVAPVNLFRQGDDYIDLLIRAEREQWDLIIFDTLQRMSAGAEANSAKDAGVIVFALDRLRRITNGSVGVVAHSGKADFDARGSSAFEDDIDIVWRVKRDDDDENVELWQDKRKDGPAILHYTLAPRHVDGTDSLVLRDAKAQSLIMTDEPKPWPKYALAILRTLARPSMIDGASSSELMDVVGIENRKSLKAVMDTLLTLGLVGNEGTARRHIYKIALPGVTQLKELGEIQDDQHED